MENRITTDWFSFWAGIVPDQKAVTILSGKQTYTYGEINKKAEFLASFLQNELKLIKGDRVGMISTNCIENIYLFSAAQKLGLILVPFNNRLTSFELNILIEDAKPSIIFVGSQFKHFDLNCKSLPLESINDLGKSQNKLDKSQCFDKDPIFILYTSGSTGVPKGVLYTHGMMHWNTLNTSISLGLNMNTCSFVCMPPFHTGGWNVLLSPTLHLGGHVILAEKFDAKSTIKDLSEYNCNQFMAVPTMLKMMAEEQSFNTISLPSLDYIIVGGEVMPIELIKLYESKSIAIRQGFGMTEAGPNLTSLHHSKSKIKIGSIGKPNMYVQVKIVDEANQELPPGNSGELCISGPIVMHSYWNKAEETKKSIKEGWLFTGDIAEIDEEGYIYIKDRKKNVYISGGENVYPAEIEKVLLSHELINDAVIIGVPDEKWGEVGKAFILTKEQLSAEEIIAFCRAKVSKFKIPKHIQFLDKIPLNSTGKIDRIALKKL